MSYISSGLILLFIAVLLELGGIAPKGSTKFVLLIFLSGGIGMYMDRYIDSDILKTLIGLVVFFLLARILKIF